MGMDVHRVLPIGPGLAQVIQAPIPRDPVEPRPGVDRTLIGQHRRVRRDEDLLQQILRILARRDHVPAEAEQPRLVPVEKHLERPVVPSTNQGDELLVALQAQ